MMGVLYQAVQSQNEMKRNFVINRLREMHITQSRQGQPIESLGYDELKQELAVAQCCQVDIESNAIKWF